MPGEQRLDGAERQRAVQQPAGRQPDGDGYGVARPLPRSAACSTASSSSQRPSSAVLRRRRPSATRRNSAGVNRMPCGGAPAGLGGDGGDPAGGELDHGLVQQRELAVVQGGAQPGGQLRLAHDVGLHLRRVQLDAVLAGRLGAVHREVGVAHQVARR